MFTRGDLITGGLEQAGRPDLKPEARLWLNLFLDQVYKDQDFDWLIKAVEITNNSPFPDDYRAARVAKIGTRQVRLTTNEDEWAMRAATGVRGETNLIFADHNDRKFYFYPENASVCSLRYFYLPTLPDHTDPDTDLESVKWGLSHQILFDFIYYRALEYNDDSRAPEAFQKAMAQVVQSKMNNHDRRAGSSKMALGKSFRKRL